MRTELFWLFSFCGFAAVSLLCGLLVWPQLVAAWSSVQDKIDRFRRLPPLAKLVLLLFGGAFVVFGGGKTNQVDQTSGTNGIVRLFGLFDCSIEEPQPTVTPEDIARCWQLWKVRTNCNVSYMMPEGATLATNWWVRGAYEDCSIVRLGDCSFGGSVNQSNNLNNPNNRTTSFPFGTNEYSSLWALSWGKARFELANANTEIVAVGAPMSAVPYRSRLWSAAGANGAKLVTWENFVFGRAPVADYQLPSTNYQLVSAQIELRATGDFITRSNEVETVYRRVDPDDWDGDGWENDDDGNPYEWEGFADYFYQELPEGANTNAYCWVEIRPKWNSWISFYGDAPSNLEDPYLWAKAGETYRVQLLIGKTYDVEGSQPFDIVAKSDERIEVMEIGANQCEVVRPVEFTVAEGQAPGSRPRLGATWNDGGKSFYVMPNPSWLRGAVTWTDNYCCDVWGDGTNFTYACDNTCTCDGCTVYGSYWYEGYGLPVWGIPCGCLYVVDVGPVDVSISFDRPAVIYEDAYTNQPGEVVHPVRSNAVLRCSVSGGTYGGTISVTLNEAAQQKLRKVRGNTLPQNVRIEPGSSRSYEVEYSVLEPSGRVGDIQATAVFHEDFLNETHTEVASMTAVKVELEAVDEAHDNPCMNRHVYGVHEWVKYRYYPSVINAELVIVGAEQDLVSSSDRFFCPWTGGTYWLRFQILGETFETDIDVYEPEVVCREVWWNQIGVTGRAGLLDMRLALYIEPTFVSFKDLNMEEIPDEEVCPHTGYFSTGDEAKIGALSHTRLAGAGVWSPVRQDTSWVADKASRETPYPQPWSDGMKEWRIPVGWGDYNGNIKGRVVPNPTTQLYTINSSGMSTIRKYNHEIRRAINNDVWLDGVVQED